MRQAILTILLAFGLAGITSVNAQSGASYAAAKWNLWLTEKTEALKPPPSPAVTKTELENIKKNMALLDEKKRAAIKYWDAGAPSYRWSQIISKVSFEKQDLQLRMPGSWTSIAVYDATVLAWREKLKHKRKRPSQSDPSIKPLVDVPDSYSYPCEHTVTAVAAATVMAYFLPAKADSLLQLARAASQSRIDAGVQYPSDAEAAWKLGEMVAKQIIEKAKNDGSAIQWKGEVNKDPKKWTGSYPFGITLVGYTPLVLKSASQFRPGPPPDFENEMKELKTFKQTGKTTYLAHYWANTADVWTDLANQKLFEYKMMDNTPEVARFYATLTSSYHEMAIAIMDAKYAYWGIRPNQYDSTYKPMIGTPPFPGYPSGHAAGSSTSATILELFFPADAKQFRQLAKDCADSRFYAGIHFRTDNEAGLEMGKQLGKYIYDTWMSKTENH
jgi:membrane-associated phospholipid phosphatase